MKKSIYATAVFTFILGYTAHAQVNIGSTSAPNTNAMLQVTGGGSKGFMMPSVALTATNSASPLSAFVAGMTVYNTATAGTSPNNVTPGFYYSDGAQWYKMVASGSGNDKNIYEGNGTLTGNRTVTQATNTLTFTGNPSGFLVNMNNTTDNNTLQVTGPASFASNGTLTAPSITSGAPMSGSTPLVSFNNSTSSTSGVTLRVNNSGGAGAGYTFIDFQSGGSGQVGSITRTAGGIAYNTTSDIRLKNHIKATRYSIADLMKIQVSDYFYNIDTTHTLQTGFIAQQLYPIFPNAVSKGGDDATKKPWTVDYGKITPLLVKAIQDQQAEIEALKAEKAQITAEVAGLKDAVAEIRAEMTKAADGNKIAKK